MKEFLMAVLLFVIPALGAETLILSGIVNPESHTKVALDASSQTFKVQNQNNFHGTAKLSVVSIGSRGPASEGTLLSPVSLERPEVRAQDIKGPRWLLVTISAP